PVNCQQIKPAVVVVIKEPVAPSEEGNCYFGNSSGVTDVSEIGVAFVAVQRVVVVRENRVVEIESSIVQIVANRDPHRRRFFSVLVQGIAGGITCVFKSPVTIIDVQIVRCGIVGDSEIHFAVIVKVGENAGQSVVVVLVRNLSFFGDVGKRAVMVVVVQPVLSEVSDVNIRPAVVVVIADGHPESPSVVRYARFRRHVHKCAIVIVVK